VLIGRWRDPSSRTATAELQAASYPQCGLLSVPEGISQPLPLQASLASEAGKLGVSRPGPIRSSRARVASAMTAGAARGIGEGLRRRARHVAVDNPQVCSATLVVLLRLAPRCSPAALRSRVRGQRDIWYLAASMAPIASERQHPCEPARSDVIISGCLSIS
jgi:hypothetical protein